MLVLIVGSAVATRTVGCAELRGSACDPRCRTDGFIGMPFRFWTRRRMKLGPALQPCFSQGLRTSSPFRAHIIMEIKVFNNTG